MNKNLFRLQGIVLICLTISNSFYSQVGINTDRPSATLDVIKNPTASVLDGIIAPRLTAVELKAKTYTADQTGAFVYVTAGFGSVSASTQTNLVSGAGYYYFDGSIWRPFGASSSSTNPTKNSWSLEGNSGISDSNFFGTTDAKTIKFRVNNLPFGIFEHSTNEFGSVGLGLYSLMNSNANLRNAAYGNYSLMNNTTGASNSGFGQGSLLALTTGSVNSAFGGGAGVNLTTGNENTLIGVSAGYNITDGNYNTHVGRGNIANNNGNVSNTISLGYFNNFNSSASGSILLGNRSSSYGENNIVIGSDSQPGTIPQAGFKSNLLTIGNFVARQDFTKVNNKILADNELIINSYLSFSDDSIPLIRGNFNPGSKYLKIGGKFILEPTLTPNATGDLSYNRIVVAKADGTIGFSTSNISSSVTVTPTADNTTRIRLTTDVFSSSNSRVSIPNWSFNVESGKVYKIKIQGAYSTVAATTGGSIGFVLSDGGVGTIFGKVKMNIVHTMTAAPEQVITTIDTNSTTVRSFGTSTGVGTINVPEGMESDLIFECTTSGVFNVQWGSEVANSQATLLRNSTLIIEEI